MKNLKKLLGFGVLMGSLMVGTTFAGTGLVFSDVARQQTCEDQSTGFADSVYNTVAGLLFSDFASGQGDNCTDQFATGILFSD